VVTRTSRSRLGRRSEVDRLSQWYTEWVSEHVMETYRVSRVIYRGRTRYQKLEILETEPFGKALILDGRMQSAMLDEHMYHETLVHPAMCLHGGPRRVVVIGGGEGGVAREALRWNTVEELYMVDIDSEVVELCQRYIPEFSSGAFTDKRIKVFFEDGRRWVAENVERPVDVFIIDVTDPLEKGPSHLLYTSEFYSLLASKLSYRGVVATHATSPTHTPLVYNSIVATLSAVFRKVSQIATYIVSYSSLWGFAYGSNSSSLDEMSGEEVERRLGAAGVAGLRFYSGATHEALLTLTRHYAGLRRVDARIIRDASPLFVT